eukprot:Blabericola_migrator_1__3749@NODE_2123_length_3237_cov_672_250789_g427_i1_p1_GENE_NODE_2123_length_3237_cov_672_250789_g427_i1NODE_2123_length_3237_cov_672_250789_g427_i1_p1_ORF_typecomplete_len719_score98_74GMC_oxred_N/PF00732_19/5_5e20GMC_oxred_N/PF00732_19/1_5e08GMC_oxred_C/PF05199_13/5_7e24FAD_binding_3/PF01494_19/0_00019GIDA/PF01134_22/4_5e05DAO/PF01266_24/0_00017DAO/PF01266_24/2_3e03FAD_binding_2/PF00890_24/0_00026FAD_binding_2/PF00890_24/1_4e03Pyr_redox/PF00070_27/0_0013Pyr_redox/PF00070_
MRSLRPLFGPLLAFISVVRATQDYGVSITYDLGSHTDGYIDETFDYIVAGGGSTGCIVARTFADAGYRTLLIERGGLPREVNYWRGGMPQALLSSVQTIVTSTGVRSHIGAILGGGSASNFGVWIEEGEEYWRKVAEATGLQSWQIEPFINRINDSLSWVRSQIVDQDDFNDWTNSSLQEDPKLSEYTSHLHQLLSAKFGEYEGAQQQLRFSKHWHPSNLVNAKGRRYSTAEVAMTANQNLVVLLNSTVLSVEWAQDNTASCLIYRAALPVDFSPLGLIDNSSLDPRDIDSRSWNRRLRQMRKPSLLEAAVVDNRTMVFPYRVCLNENPESRIILAGGAVHSPLMAMRSGVGPAAELAKLKDVRARVINEHVGQNLRDRPMLPLSVFLDGWKPSERVLGSVRMAAIKHLENGRLFPFEEITGSTALQSTLIAVREMFPIAMRNGFWGELGGYLMGQCVLTDRFELLGNVFPIIPKAGFLPDLEYSACKLFSPQARCFRNAIAWLTFVSDVKSTGGIRLDLALPEQPIIDVNYLANPEDESEFVQNVRDLLMMFREAAQTFSGVFVSADNDWCPARVFENDFTLLASLAEMNHHQYKMTQAQTWIPAAEVKQRRARVPQQSAIPLASFPQLWPDPDDAEAVAHFAKRYFTSMWHFLGTMQLGRVVDENFDVYGVSRLSVMDAGILPVMPRMNPSAAVMAAARAAATTKVMKRQTVTSTF